MRRKEALQAQMGDLVDRVVKAADPSRIVIFGSTARGERRRQSDLDVLAIVKDGTHRGHTCERIYPGMRGFGKPTDVVVVTESDVRQHRNDPYGVIMPALKKGMEVYRRARTNRPQ